MDAEAGKAFHSFAWQLRNNAGYLARKEANELLEKIRSDPKRLEPFGFKVYSQNEEDGIVEEIFNRLRIERGLFCEIGVENGLECNTLYLIHKGWRGWWIEGNQAQRDRILGKFSSLIQSDRLRLIIGFITAENINQAFADGKINNKELDFLSIDVDGNDVYLFDALKISPKVICIEYNAKFPPPLSKKPVYNPENMWRGGDYIGSSLVAINETAHKKGYTLVGTNITAGRFLYS